MLLIMQERNIAKLEIARYEHCYVGSCKIGTLINFKLQDSSIAKCQDAI